MEKEETETQLNASCLSVSGWRWPLSGGSQAGGSGGPGDGLVGREGRGRAAGCEQWVIYGANKHSGSVFAVSPQVMSELRPLRASRVCAAVAAMARLGSGIWLLWALLMGTPPCWGPRESPPALSPS